MLSPWPAIAFSLFMNAACRTPVNERDIPTPSTVELSNVATTLCAPVAGAMRYQTERFRFPVGCVQLALTD